MRPATHCARSPQRCPSIANRWQHPLIHHCKASSGQLPSIYIYSTPAPSVILPPLDSAQPFGYCISLRVYPGCGWGAAPCCTIWAVNASTRQPATAVCGFSSGLTCNCSGFFLSFFHADNATSTDPRDPNLITISSWLEHNMFYCRGVD